MSVLAELMHTPSCIHAYRHTYKHTYIHTYVRASVRTCRNTCMHGCAEAYASRYICTYLCTEHVLYEHDWECSIEIWRMCSYLCSRGIRAPCDQDCEACIFQTQNSRFTILTAALAREDPQPCAPARTRKNKLKSTRNPKP